MKTCENPTISSHASRDFPRNRHVTATTPGSYWAQLLRLAEVQHYFGPAGKASAECLSQWLQWLQWPLLEVKQGMKLAVTWHGLLSFLDALDLEELYYYIIIYIYIWIVPNQLINFAYQPTYPYMSGTCHADLRNRVYEDMPTCHTLQRWPIEPMAPGNAPRPRIRRQDKPLTFIMVLVLVTPSPRKKGEPCHGSITVSLQGSCVF